MDKNLYLFNVILVVFFAIQLMHFRSGIYEYLRANRSKTYMRKKRKGFLNYWIYRQINEEYPLGKLYYVNIVYLVSVAAFSALALCLGYLEIMKFPLYFISTVVSLIGVGGSLFGSAYCNQAKYGKKFILLRKRKSSGGYDSILVDLCLAFGSFVLICIIHS